MGMMDKFLNAMRLNSDDDDEFYDEEEEFYDDEEDFYEPPRTKRFFSRNNDRAEKAVKEDPVMEEPKRSFTSKVTPMRSARKAAPAPSQGMAVCVIKPTSVEDAREITETLLDGRTVVLNLEGLDLEIGQRLIDFTSGSCYAIGGNLQKISNYIFIVTPANVDISGDFLSIVDAFDVSSLQHDI